jgi:hypothetical protein
MLILEIWLDQGPGGTKKLREVGLFTNVESMKEYMLLNPAERHNHQYYRDRWIEIIK